MSFHGLCARKILDQRGEPGIDHDGTSERDEGLVRECCASSGGSSVVGTPVKTALCGTRQKSVGKREQLSHLRRVRDSGRRRRLSFVTSWRN